MITYIAILRGINVGGKRLIKMDALKAMCSRMGFQNIQTYIQSGNLIFQYQKQDPIQLSKKIEQEIAEHFLFDVPVIVLELEELDLLIDNNPFGADTIKNTDFFHVTFLSDVPDVDLINVMTEVGYQDDEFYHVHKAIYLYCPNGYSNSKLTNGFIEKKLKVTATTRNWKTTKELQRIAVISKV